MKASRRPPRGRSRQIERVQIQPEIYAFYEKRSGTTYFRVQAGPGGRLPVDHAAALLAMHCLVRGQSPSDYGVMVGAGDKLTKGLSSRATALLKAGRLMSAPVSLTRREEEVLRGVMQSQTNKEIAAALNLSERTIKFHISSLLAKFRVRSRMELAREAARTSLPGPYVAGVDAGVVPAIGGPVHSLELPGNTVRRPMHNGAVVPMRGRRMTA